MWGKEIISTTIAGRLERGQTAKLLSQTFRSRLHRYKKNAVCQLVCLGFVGEHSKNCNHMVNILMTSNILIVKYLEQWCYAGRILLTIFNATNVAEKIDACVYKPHFMDNFYPYFFAETCRVKKHPIIYF